MKLHLSKHELDSTQKSGGLEITIDGIQGDPTEKCPGTSVFLEWYDGKMQLHVWTENQQDAQTIILTPLNETGTK